MLLYIIPKLVDPSLAIKVIVFTIFQDFDLEWPHINFGIHKSTRILLFSKEHLHTKCEVENSCISWAIEFTSQESLTHENHCHCILLCHQQGIRIEETYYTFAPDLAALVTRRLLSSRFLSLSDLQANWQTAIRLLNPSDSAIFYPSLGEIWPPVKKWKRMKFDWRVNSSHS